MKFVRSILSDGIWETLSSECGLLPLPQAASAWYLEEEEADGHWLKMRRDPKRHGSD